MAKRVVWVVLCIGALSACGGSTPEPKVAAKSQTAASATAGSETTASADASATPATSPSAASPDATADASTAPKPAVDPSQPVPLPPQVDGGEISRPELLAVLQRGVGRFLQRVRVSAERDAQGRFAGWQIVQLFPGETDVAPVVKAGDTLLRVNGQSVERPEQLKTVWDSLVTSSELVLTVRRAGQQSEIRYRIVEPAVAAPTAATTPKRS